MVEFVPLSEVLRVLPEWKQIDGRAAIQRKFRFKDFSRAWSFLTEVAILAATRQVFPEIYNNTDRVTLVISGEDFSLSEPNLELAKSVDSLLASLTPPAPPKAQKKAPSRSGR